MNKHKIIATSVVAAIFSVALVNIPVSATTTSGNVQLNAEVATSIAMKIASPNDTNPDCTPSDLNGDGVIDENDTYGVVNRYATSNGAEGSKMVDTFDGTTGGADEVNTNTSCATLSMEPNTYSSTYSDVTVYTNSPSGYALTVQSAGGVSPALTNISDNTLTIPAGVLTENSSTVPGGQNLWSYKTDSGIITDWTAVTTSPIAIKSYDTHTEGGDTTRITYGISTGNNPVGKYATTLTYTATMFDDTNPYVSKITIPETTGLSTNFSELSIPFGQSATVTVAPASSWYLSGVTCPTGFTCTGYTTDKTNAASQGAQTITVTNNNTATTGTLSFAATELFKACSSSTAVGDTCYMNSSSDVEMIRLADGNFWTKNSQGTATWDNLNSISCPSGTSKPTAIIFQTLVKAYGGTNNGNYGSPYGTLDSDADIYNATGWVGSFWSTTAVSNTNSSLAWVLYVDDGGGSDVAYVSKSYSLKIVCYASSDTMQTFSASAHSSDAVGTTYSLLDARDGKTYSAAKLADGNIWMTTDLKFGGDSDVALAPSSSDVSSSFTLNAPKTLELGVPIRLPPATTKA